MKSKNVNMLKGSVTKGLIAMTVPIMIMNVMQVLFSAADMAILRIFSNDTAVGAVGACGMLLIFCTSLLTGISVGTNVVVAKRVGSGDSEGAEKSAMTSIAFSLVSSVLLMIVGIVFGEKFLVMTNCPESLLPKALSYFKIYFYGVPVLMLYTFCGAILRSIGETKKPMYYLLIGGAVKIFVTLFVVCVFKVDVEGVALATIVSNLVACLLTIYTLVRGQNVIKINFRALKFDMHELKETLAVGIPAGVQSAMYTFANVVITTAVNSFGAHATTGVAIANQFDGILYQISLAPSLAVTPYIAQNIGAGNIARAKKVFLRATLITVIFGGGLGVLSAIFSAELSSLMSSNPAVIAFSQQKMIIISSTYFICGINEVLSGVLRGIGKTVLPTVSAFVFLCALRFVWVYAVFPMFPNLTFLYTVWPIGWALSILTLLCAYFPAIAKLERKALV